MRNLRSRFTRNGSRSLHDKNGAEVELVNRNKAHVAALREKGAHITGTVTGDAYARKVAIRCMKECIDVGHAAGAEFAPVQGKNITKLFYYTNAFKRKIGELLIPIAMKKHKDIIPSMLQDLRNGKPCEVDAINGVVCEWGRKCGISTPVNDRIVEVIKKEQSGELKPEAANIKLFDDLL